jgi:hypothetical protein
MAATLIELGQSQPTVLTSMLVAYSFESVDDETGETQLEEYKGIIRRSLSGISVSYSGSFGNTIDYVRRGNKLIAQSPGPDGC